MRTITTTHNLYQYSELNVQAKERAYIQWLSSSKYDFFRDEIRATLSAFETAFGIKVTNWSYDENRYYFRFQTTTDDDIEKLCGVRLLRYLVNNHWDTLFKPKVYFTKDCYKSRKSRINRHNCCVLTGVAYDEDILAPLYKFLKHPHRQISFHTLMDKCLHNFWGALQEELEYYNSEEYFQTMCLDYEYEFFEDGRMYG